MIRDDVPTIDLPHWSASETLTHKANSSCTFQQHVRMPFANQRLATKLPAGGPASLSDLRIFPEPHAANQRYGTPMCSSTSKHQSTVAFRAMFRKSESGRATSKKTFLLLFVYFPPLLQTQGGLQRIGLLAIPALLRISNRAAECYTPSPQTPFIFTPATARNCIDWREALVQTPLMREVGNGTYFSGCDGERGSRALWALDQMNSGAASGGHTEINSMVRSRGMGGGMQKLFLGEIMRVFPLFGRELPGEFHCGIGFRRLLVVQRNEEMVRLPFTVRPKAKHYALKTNLDKTGRQLRPVIWHGGIQTSDVLLRKILPLLLNKDNRSKPRYHGSHRSGSCLQQKKRIIVSKSRVDVAGKTKLTLSIACHTLQRFRDVTSNQGELSTPSRGAHPVHTSIIHLRAHPSACTSCHGSPADRSCRVLPNPARRLVSLQQEHVSGMHVPPEPAASWLRGEEDLFRPAQRGFSSLRVLVDSSKFGCSRQSCDELTYVKSVHDKAAGYAFDKMFRSNQQGPSNEYLPIQKWNRHLYFEMQVHDPDEWRRGPPTCPNRMKKRDQCLPAISLVFVFTFLVLPSSPANGEKGGGVPTSPFSFHSPSEYLIRSYVGTANPPCRFVRQSSFLMTLDIVPAIFSPTPVLRENERGAGESGRDSYVYIAVPLAGGWEGSEISNWANETALGSHRSRKTKNIVLHPQPLPASLPRSGPLLDFRMWESCRTMALVDGFSRGFLPFHLVLSFRHDSVLTSLQPHISSRKPIWVKQGEYGAAQECKGVGTGGPRKNLADQLHCPALFPYAKVQDATTPGINPVSPRWEARSLATTSPRRTMANCNEGCESKRDEAEREEVSWRRHTVLNPKSSRAVMLPVSSSLAVEGDSKLRFHDSIQDRHLESQAPLTNIMADNCRPAEDVNHFGGQRLSGGDGASRHRD
ncbi:hypothetical protein PR048_020313 [Dryococelus australis]|uniref:Uncharacterized protein n=1 Tax=Dryococelus australis TaxID=614101 RepID=A0ABQ9H5Y2_9NEOP|nr:hypothetical protein PR048_020313 [Dryococelus australis]